MQKSLQKFKNVKENLINCKKISLNYFKVKNISGM